MSNQETLLFDLEDKLGSSIGKKLRYQNQIRQRYNDKGVTPTIEQKIAVAEEILDEPWLGVLGALAERVEFERHLK